MQLTPKRRATKMLKCAKFVQNKMLIIDRYFKLYRVLIILKYKI